MSQCRILRYKWRLNKNLNEMMIRMTLSQAER
jgi:hypothetical protein